MRTLSEIIAPPVAFVALLYLAAGCTRTVTEPVAVKVPVPLVSPVPPELLVPVVQHDPPVFVVPTDPKAVACLTVEGSERFAQWSFDLIAGNQVCRAWVRARASEAAP